MCGISIIAGARVAEQSSPIERMVKALRHRGPDGQVWERLAGCHLGHTRLSIIDLDTGAQPMKVGSGRYWIVFNGEIYNYRELRRKLQQEGQHFRTSSDTEVILCAFAQWGPRCLERFRGMFAFAIWDAKEQRLFAARDLFGEKPLYYAITPDGLLLIGSEIKALLASSLLRSQLDLEAVNAYLAFGSENLANQSPNSRKFYCRRCSQ